MRSREVEIVRRCFRNFLSKIGLLRYAGRECGRWFEAGFSEEALGDDVPGALYVYKRTMSARSVLERIERLAKGER